MRTPKNYVNLKPRKLGRLWWLIGDEEPIGGFNSQSEALKVRASLYRSMRNLDTPGYWTQEKRNGRKNSSTGKRSTTRGP